MSRADMQLLNAKYTPTVVVVATACCYILYKQINNICGFCFICVESAKESHCSAEHSTGNFVIYICQKSAKTVKFSLVQILALTNNDVQGQKNKF